MSIPSRLGRASALVCWIMPVNKPIVLIFLFSFEWFALVDTVVLLLSPLQLHVYIGGASVIRGGWRELREMTALEKECRKGNRKEKRDREGN